MVSPWRSWADRLTLFRAVLGAPVLLALAAEQLSTAWLLLLLGAFSDWADGWMARKADGGSSWGARLDPLADKLLISAPLIWLASEQVLPLWSVWLLLARELLISGWRSASQSGAPASWIGKTKTTLQFLSLFLLIWPPSWGAGSVVLGLRQLGWSLYWPALGLALWSGLAYITPLTAGRRRR